MAKEFDEETGTAAETADGNAGVSERTESQIEGAEGAETLEADDSKDADEALEALAEADPKRAVVGLKKRIAKLTAQRNSARTEAAERKALEARVAAFEKRERDAVEARKRAERATPEGQKAEAEKRAVRDAIDKAYWPGYADQQEQAALERREAEQRAAEEYAMKGISYLKSELEDHGIAVDDKKLVGWERAVGSEIAEDPELKAAFKRPATQEGAIKEAFRRVSDGIANPILKDRGAKPLERIQRNREALLGTSTPGAVAGTPEPEFNLKPPKELKGRALDQWWADARENYWQQLSKSEAQG